MSTRLRAVLGVILLAVTACGSDAAKNATPTSTSTKQLRPLTLMLNWTPNNHHAGIYIALAKGWYRDAGLDVKIVDADPNGVEPIVAQGGADIGIAQAESILPARAQGIPVVSIATLLPHNDSALMALPTSGITRPKDLEGKTYGGYGGALETELVSKLVACDGGDPAKVKFVEVGNIDYLAGMDAKKFDFVWIFAGWDALRAQTVEQRPVELIRFSDHFDCIPDWYTPALITSEKMLADRPDDVRAFLAATARGYDDARQNPSDAVSAMMSSASGLDEKLVTASASYYAPLYAADGQPWGVESAVVWTAFEKFARSSGLIDTDVDVSKVFTNEYLPKPSG
jgi:ABC-type nitrate/sulfonate/bicarbonate transport system substrate-binding protein